MPHDLTVNYASSKKQIYEGIEVLGRASLGAAYTEEVLESVYGYLVDHVGVTQLRIEVLEDGEPSVGSYDWTTMDARITQVVTPAIVACNARWGRPPAIHFVYVGYAIAGGHPHNTATSGYLTNIANYLVAAVQYFESTTGIQVRYLGVCLEPDHTAQPITTEANWATLVSDLRSKLDAARLQHVDITGPEAYNGLDGDSFITTLNSTYPSAFAHLRVFTIHGYGGTTRFDEIEALAATHGRPFWETEFLGMTAQTLYDYLSFGVRRVQKYGPITPSFSGGGASGFLLGHTIANGFPEDDVAQLEPNVHTEAIRVLTEHVHPGSQYLTVSSNPAGRAACAWRRLDGKLVVVVRQGNRTLSGTVTTSAGSPTLTGSGTQFTTQLAPGDTVVIDRLPGTAFTVSSIATNTSLTLASAVPNTYSTGRTIYSSDSFEILNLLPGSYTVYFAGTNGIEDSTPAASVFSTYNVGSTFSVRVKAGPSPVYQASPTIDIPTAASVVAIVQN